MGKIRILIADDQTLVRKALCNRLEVEADLNIVADVASADEAIEEAKHLRPDVALLTVEMPGLRAFEGARRIHLCSPETRLLFVSAALRDTYISEALAVGAAGYLTKHETPAVLIEAIRTVHAGGTYFSGRVRSRLVMSDDGGVVPPETPTRLARLSPREIDVLQYIAQGLPKKQIAVLMNLSIKTVDAHCARLMNKLRIHDRVELTLFAIREGLVQP